MIDRRHKAAVERRLADALRLDKARIELGRISKFGLLEMSRQRLRASLSSQSQIKCGQCQGIGTFKNPELVALEVLRKIEAAVMLGNISNVRTRLSPSAALFLLNGKKAALVRLEQEYKAQIMVLADGRLRPDEYDFEMESSRVNNDAVIAAHRAEQLENGDEDDTAEIPA
jgi:ribonuclease E